MKLYGETKVMVPWFDAEGMKQWQILTFRAQPGSSLDKRALLKHVERHIKNAFGKVVSHSWIKKNCPIVNSEDQALAISHDSAYADMIEAFIDRVSFKEGDVDPSEAEAEGHPDSQTEDVGNAGMDVHDLHNPDEEHTSI